MSNSEINHSLYSNRLFYAYKKHGWFPVFENNNTLLIYSDKNKGKLLFIAQSIDFGKIISCDQAISSLNNLEEKYSDSFDCSAFTLFSPNGFEKKAYNLNKFNCALIDMSELNDLENHDERIMLLPHNQSAFTEILDKIKNTGRAASVRATGTGKTYLSAKLIEHFQYETLVIAPGNFILSNHQNINGDENIQYLTYAKLAVMSESEINNINAKLVVLDEFHRAGASTWGAGVKQLLDSHSSAYVLGTSATAIRHLDGQRDMTKELGFGDPVAPLPLEEAIVKGILPAPTYISALYDMNETIKKTRAILEANHSPEKEKLVSLAELSDIAVNWKESQGIEAIIQKHLNKSSGKYIVFFEDQQHLSDFSPTVKEWFKKNNASNITTFQVSSNTSSTNKASLESFEAADPNHATSILFSVNMLNEGLHVKGVSGLFMLRKTASENIYYQQLGRGFDAGSKDGTIVFDLVNNLDNITTSSIQFKINEAFDKNNKDRMIIGLNSHSSNSLDYTGKITDESLDLRERLSFIKNNFSFRERVKDAISLINSYKEAHGTYIGWSKNNDFENQDIATELNWLKRQYRENRLSKTEMKFVENTGFDFNSDQAYKYEKNIKSLSQFIKLNNRLPKESEIDVNGDDVGNIFKKIRAMYRNEAISEERKQNIREAIGEFTTKFDIDLRDITFEKNIETLTSFVSLHDRLPKNTEVSAEGDNIGAILVKIKNAYKRNNNPEEKKEKIRESLGRFSSTLDMNQNDADFDKSLAIIKSFIRLNNRLPFARELDLKGNKVGVSLNSIKHHYKNNHYSDVKKQMILNAFGKFSGSIEANHYDILFEKSLVNLTQFIELHDRLPIQSESDAEGNRVGNTLNKIKGNYKMQSYPDVKKEKISESLGRFKGILKVNATSAAFNKSLADLVRFTKKNGRLPKALENDINGNKVGTTISSIKTAFKRGTYSKERISIIRESMGEFSNELPEAKEKQVLKHTGTEGPAF